jgi:short-subunit dehydrogenase
VVTLSESLHHELALRGARVRASVLCPGWVDTRILDSHRNRPSGPGAGGPLWNFPGADEIEKRVRERIASGLSPGQVAERVLDAIRDERFWILTHPELNDLIRTRMQDILEQRAPSFVPLF